MTGSVKRPDAPPDAPAVRAGPGRAVRSALAVAAAAAVVALMVAASVWQWDRGRARGALLNYAYAVEWLLFAVLTVVGLVRLHREGRRADTPSGTGPVGPAPVSRPGGPVVGPPLAPGEELEEVTWLRLRRRIGLDRR